MCLPVHQRIAWTALGVLLSIAQLRCSDPDEAGPTGVTGQWCGRQVARAEDCTGDEVFFLDLIQSGQSVTGQYCEAYAHDCYGLQSGKFTDDRLTFFYTFDVNRVDVNLEAAGDTLIGTFTTTNASAPVILYRVR
jgi:hypothetical protein